MSPSGLHLKKCSIAVANRKLEPQYNPDLLVGGEGGGLAAAAASPGSRDRDPTPPHMYSNILTWVPRDPRPPHDTTSAPPRLDNPWTSSGVDKRPSHPVTYGAYASSVSGPPSGQSLEAPEATCARRSDDPLKRGSGHQIASGPYDPLDPV